MQELHEHMTIPEFYGASFRPYFGAVNLNLGSALNKMVTSNGHRWINVDMNPAVKPELVWDLRSTPMPFEDNSTDCIFASHIFEHLEKIKFIELVADIHRILRPGGYLVGVTPYGTSDDAWANPLHLINFSEHTWALMDARKYRKPNTHGYGADQEAPFRDWKIVQLLMVPYSEFEGDPELPWKVRHLRNMVIEMMVVMEAVK